MRWRLAVGGAALAICLSGCGKSTDEGRRAEPEPAETKFTLVDEAKYPPIETPSGTMYKIQDAPPSAGPDYDKLVAAAAAAREARDFPTALDRARAALEIDPERMLPRSIAAEASCELGKIEEAIEHIGKLKGIWIDIAIDECVEAGVKFPEGSVKRFEMPQ